MKWNVVSVSIAFAMIAANNQLPAQTTSKILLPKAKNKQVQNSG